MSLEKQEIKLNEHIILEKFQESDRIYFDILTNNLRIIFADIIAKENFVNEISLNTDCILLYSYLKGKEYPLVIDGMYNIKRGKVVNLKAVAKLMGYITCIEFSPIDIKWQDLLKYISSKTSNPDMELKIHQFVQILESTIPTIVNEKILVYIVQNFEKFQFFVDALDDEVDCNENVFESFVKDYRAFYQKLLLEFNETFKRTRKKK